MRRDRKQIEQSIIDFLLLDLTYETTLKQINIEDKEDNYQTLALAKHLWNNFKTENSDATTKQEDRYLDSIINKTYETIIASNF